MKSMLIILFASLQVFAGECVLTLTRDACPGKEDQSYSKCNGAKNCDVVVTADSILICAKLAIENCKNSRLDITKYKSVTAIFDHQSLDDKRDFCAADIGAYKVVDNYPFKNKADCK